MQVNPSPLEPILVFFKDDESEFSAPIDKIWKYWKTHKISDHKCISNASWEVLPNGFISTYDFRHGDEVVKIKFRGTFYPPLGFMMEYLDGSTLAGSRVFQYYVPKGDKTGVCVVGDVVLPADLPPARMQAVAVALDALSEQMFQEDNEILSKIV